MVAPRTCKGAPREIYHFASSNRNMQTWPSVHHKFRKIESVQYLTHSRTKTFITESFEGGYFTHIARNVMLGYGKTQDEQFTMNTEGQN